MTQPPRRPAGPASSVLGALAADVDRLAGLVARDVVGDGPIDEHERTRSAAAVHWLLDALRAGRDPSSAELLPLRAAAADAARSGEPLRSVLDRSLSAGWVVWAALTERDVGPQALAALGTALLRAGDAAAAAIADAYAAVEREAAIRDASARRELLDALLGLDPDDALERVRLLGRARALGIRADAPLRVVVAARAGDLEDDDPELPAVARRLAGSPVAAVGDLRELGATPPRPVVATWRGRLLVLLPHDDATMDARLARALATFDRPLTAVAATAPDGLAGVAGAAADAAASLDLVPPPDAAAPPHVLDAADLGLERALLADPARLRSAVEHELAPLRTAPRGAELVPTVAAYLEERESIRATARRLGVAPRTVVYRLERIARLLGRPLDGALRQRLAVALFADRLLRLSAAAPADRSPRGPAGRSSPRRSRGRGRRRAPGRP